MRIKVKIAGDVAARILSSKLGYAEMAASLHGMVKGFISKGINNFVFGLGEIESGTTTG